MKMNELIELMNNNKNKLLKAEQIQAFLKKELEVKDYLGIKEKKDLIESIVDECILYENGVFKFDDIEKYICFTMKVIAAYTNLELSDDIEDDYDLLCKAKQLDAVIGTFRDEYENVNILLQMRCDYSLIGTSIEAHFGRFLDGILEKLDEVADVLSNKVGDFNINDLINNEDLQKVLKFVNTYNK